MGNWGKPLHTLNQAYNTFKLPTRVLIVTMNFELTIIMKISMPYNPLKYLNNPP